VPYTRCRINHRPPCAVRTWLLIERALGDYAIIHLITSNKPPALTENSRPISVYRRFRGEGAILMNTATAVAPEFFRPNRGAGDAKMHFAPWTGVAGAGE